jgi:hypothetical protein
MHLASIVVAFDEELMKTGAADDEDGQPGTDSTVAV